MEEVPIDSAAQHGSRLSPSFPIHGKSILLTFLEKEAEEFKELAEQLARRGAVHVGSTSPQTFLTQLQKQGATVIEQKYDLVLFSIPVEGLGRNMTEVMMDDGLSFSMHLAKHLALANITIPCVAITRSKPDGSDLLQGSFRFVLHKPLDVYDLEVLINNEELFDGYGNMDLDKIAMERGGDNNTLNQTEVLREERRRLLKRGAEMQRLSDSEESVRQVAGLVQWATVEGLTVPRTAHVRGVPYWQQGDLDAYTHENLRRRLKLRHHKGVVHCIRGFWIALYPLRSEIPDPDEDQNDDNNDDGNSTDDRSSPIDPAINRERKYLPERGYKTFHRVLQKIVIPPEDFDDSLADATAHADW